MHPACQRHALADVFGAQLAAGMATEGGARHGAAMVADEAAVSDPGAMSCWPAA
jgi:hypothetical protein